METFWDEEAAIATERFFVIDAASGAVTRYAFSTQSYDEEQITSLLREAGFGEIEIHPNLTGKSSSEPDEFYVVVAHR